MTRVKRIAKATVRGRIHKRNKPPVKAGENHGYGHGGLFTAKVVKINQAIKEGKDK